MEALNQAITLQMVGGGGDVVDTEDPAELPPDTPLNYGPLFDVVAAAWYRAGNPADDNGMYAVIVNKYPLDAGSSLTRFT